MRPCRSNWPYENSFFDIPPTSYLIFLKFSPVIDLVKTHLFYKFHRNLTFDSLVIVHWNLDLWSPGLATLFSFLPIFQVRVILYPKASILYYKWVQNISVLAPKIHLAENWKFPKFQTSISDLPIIWTFTAYLTC